jgi:hypothetical protein
MESQQAEATPGSTPLLDGWLDRVAVAAELGVSTDTLARWESRRVGPPCARVGRKVLYRAQAFRDWLTERESSQVATPKKRGAK